MSASGPTPAELRALRAIDQALKQRGYPPTFRELCDSLGLASTSGMYQKIRSLERKGLLTRQSMVARSLLLTEAGRLVAVGVVTQRAWKVGDRFTMNGQIFECVNARGGK